MPKKAKSVAQWKFLKAAEAGKTTGGPSPQKAHEMLAGQATPKGLPKKLTGRARKPR